MCRRHVGLHKRTPQANILPPSQSTPANPPDQHHQLHSSGTQDMQNAPYLPLTTHLNAPQLVYGFQPVLSHHSSPFSCTLQRSMPKAHVPGKVPGGKVARKCCLASKAVLSKAAWGGRAVVVLARKRLRRRVGVRIFGSYSLGEVSVMDRREGRREGDVEIKGIFTLLELYRMISMTTPNSRVCLIWTGFFLCRAGVQEDFIEWRYGVQTESESSG